MPYELSVKICSFRQRGAFIAEDLFAMNMIHR